MTHTPGPWKKACVSWGSYFEPPSVGVNLPNQKQIRIGKENDPEDEANAALIAAAPDLLEALKQISEAYGNKGRQFDVVQTIAREVLQRHNLGRNDE